MKQFIIENNQYLIQNIQAFYHTDFGGKDMPGNPNYLYKFKNDPHHNWSDYSLQIAQQELERVLLIDLPEIFLNINSSSLIVCVVPRAKADNTYQANQMLFRTTIRNAVNKLDSHFIDGTHFIVRHKNTKTTHLRLPIDGYNNDGLLPYVGITKDTCNISNAVIGKDILLIDDIYTRTVNIDEDAIQALLDKGANSVSFYAIGKTILY